jgi:hypothetical protein
MGVGVAGRRGWMVEPGFRPRGTSFPPRDRNLTRRGEHVPAGYGSGYRNPPYLP